MKKILIILILLISSYTLTGCDIYYTFDDETAYAMYNNGKSSIINKDMNFNDFLILENYGYTQITVISEEDVKYYSHTTNSYEEYYRDGYLYTYCSIHETQNKNPFAFNDFDFEIDINNIIDVIQEILINDDKYVIDYKGVGMFKLYDNHIKINLNSEKLIDDNIIDDSIKNSYLTFHYNKNRSFTHFEYYVITTKHKTYIIGSSYWYLGFYYPDYIDW